MSVAALPAWATVFVAICVQASPYLALGVVVSTAITVFVPATFFARALPRRPALAVPVAGLAGAALPGCECGSVPVSAALMRRGVGSAPAVAFLLAAPAINPVVLVATAVAYPHRPVMVLARFVASLAAALVVGWVWLRRGRAPTLPPRRDADAGPNRFAAAATAAGHDLGQGLGLLVIGAALAATVDVVVPARWLDAVAGAGVGGVVALAVLAVLVAVCSEADAFVASSFVRFSLTAQLAFMVVGPMVDVKLIALQSGTFGRRFAARLGPLTFVAALGAAVTTAGVLL